MNHLAACGHQRSSLGRCRMTGQREIVRMAAFSLKAHCRSRSSLLLPALANATVPPTQEPVGPRRNRKSSTSPMARTNQGSRAFSATIATHPGPPRRS
jgi:hypothetical protein